MNCSWCFFVCVCFFKSILWHLWMCHDFCSFFFFAVFFLFPFIFISWRLITLQYCSGFCHTLTWISHGFTCVPHSDPPSHLPLHPIPLGLPSTPGPSACLMHPTWAGDLPHPRQYTCFDAVLLKHPTLAFSQVYEMIFSFPHPAQSLIPAPWCYHLNKLPRHKSLS